MIVIPIGEKKKKRNKRKIRTEEIEEKIVEKSNEKKKFHPSEAVTKQEKV